MITKPGQPKPAQDRRSRLFDPTSLGGTSSIRWSPAAPFDAEEEVRKNDGMEVVEPTDGRFGLTNIGDVSADDWAADTGPTKTPESRD